MEPSFKAKFESYQNRAQRVAAIKKAVQEESYEPDSTEVANILIIHLLNHSTRLHRSYLKGQYPLSKIPAVH
jgi:hypothetical protein